MYLLILLNSRWRSQFLTIDSKFKVQLGRGLVIILCDKWQLQCKRHSFVLVSRLLPSPPLPCSCCFSFCCISLLLVFWFQAKLGLCYLCVILALNKALYEHNGHNRHILYDPCKNHKKQMTFFESPWEIRLVYISNSILLMNFYFPSNETNRYLIILLMLNNDE